jgi:hypothetical protein
MDLEELVNVWDLCNLPTGSRIYFLLLDIGNCIISNYSFRFQRSKPSLHPEEWGYVINERIKKECESYSKGNLSILG